MSKHKQANKQSRDIRAQANKIVNSLNLSGDNKAQTQAIVKGVQRGMEMFLRQQAERSRELDKKTKQLKKQQLQQSEVPPADADPVRPQQNRLPWVLLALSWGCFVLTGFVFVVG